MGGINLSGGDAHSEGEGEAKGGDVSAELSNVSNTEGSEVKNDTSTKGVPPWLVGAILALVGSVLGLDVAGIIEVMPW